MVGAGGVLATVQSTAMGGSALALGGIKMLGGAAGAVAGYLW